MRGPASPHRTSTFPGRGLGGVWAIHCAVWAFFIKLKSNCLGLAAGALILVKLYFFLCSEEASGPEGNMVRRRLLSRLSQALGLGLLASGSAAAQSSASTKRLKILMRSSWGSDDPTRASFPFAHGLALSDAGHEVRIFLTGEATYLMRKATAAAIFPIGWPPLNELRENVVAKHIPVFS